METSWSEMSEQQQYVCDKYVGKLEKVLLYLKEKAENVWFLMQMTYHNSTNFRMQ